VAFYKAGMKTSNSKPYIKYSLVIVLFTIALLERVVFDLGANIEIVTAAIVLTSIYVGRKEAFWLALAIMAITDRIIGNNSILLFTWSGFLIPALLLTSVINKLGKKGVRKYFTGTGAGLGTNLFFFIWTNFGVWLMDIWGMYPKTPQGLIMSYINGLPFLRNQFISSLLFIPLGIMAIEVCKLFSRKYRASFAKLYQKHATS
jgi:hypothetical protein